MSHGASKRHGHGVKAAIDEAAGASLAMNQKYQASVAGA
jgi:hypothetical protein